MDTNQTATLKTLYDAAHDRLNELMTAFATVKSGAVPSGVGPSSAVPTVAIRTAAQITGMTTADSASDVDAGETKEGAQLATPDTTQPGAAQAANGDASTPALLPALCPASKALCRQILDHAVTFDVAPGSWERSLFSASKDDFAGEEAETGCFRCSRNLWYDLALMRVHVACQLLNVAADAVEKYERQLRFVPGESDGVFDDAAASTDDAVAASQTENGTVWQQRKILQAAGRLLDRVAAAWAGIDDVLKEETKRGKIVDTEYAFHDMLADKLGEDRPAKPLQHVVDLLALAGGDDDDDAARRGSDTSTDYENESDDAMTTTPLASAVGGMSINGDGGVRRTFTPPQ